MCAAHPTQQLVHNWPLGVLLKVLQPTPAAHPWCMEGLHRRLLVCACVHHSRVTLTAFVAASTCSQLPVEAMQVALGAAFQSCLTQLAGCSTWVAVCSCDNSKGLSGVAASVCWW